MNGMMSSSSWEGLQLYFASALISFIVSLLPMLFPICEFDIQLLELLEEAFMCREQNVLYKSVENTSTIDRPASAIRFDSRGGDQYLQFNKGTL